MREEERRRQSSGLLRVSREPFGLAPKRAVQVPDVVLPALRIRPDDKNSNGRRRVGGEFKVDVTTLAAQVRSEMTRDASGRAASSCRSVPTRFRKDRHLDCSISQVSQKWRRWAV